MQRNSRDRSRARASFAGSAMISSGCTVNAEFATQTTKPSDSAIMRTDFIRSFTLHRRRPQNSRLFYIHALPGPGAGQRYRVMRYRDDGADRIRTNSNAPVAEAFA